MDAKYFAKIKSRTETAKHEGFGLQQFDDLDVLIAEVERCNEQHQCDVHNVAAMQTTIDQQAKNCEKLLAMACKKIYNEIGCPAETSNSPSWPECDGEAGKCGDDREPWECWEKLFLQRLREANEK